ncbi:hypothetical protein VPHD148_0214 [Vibrio phage D148]
MMTNTEIVDLVAEQCGTKARHFEPGTRAGILKRERMAKLTKACTEAEAQGRTRKVTINPRDMELIVRGGTPNGRLD